MATQSLEEFLLEHPQANHSSRVFVNSLGISVLPTLLTFPSITVNQESEEQSSVVRNSGIRNLTINDISKSGQFDFTSDCPEVLGPGESCTINAKFVPTIVGAAAGSITVRTNGGTRQIRLLGNAIAEVDSNWDHIADIDGMLNSLWGFLQRSVRPALKGESGPSRPSLSVPTTSVVFASQVDVGEEFEIYTLVLTNTGDAELVLTDPIVDGDFEIVP